jgi:hypothetical protein
MSRWCKTCAHLRSIPTHGDDGRPLTLYRCGYTAPAPWPALRYTPSFVIGPRHVNGDWSEEMDCPTWEAQP